MTIKQTFALIRAIPYNVTADRQSGEWRIRLHSDPATDYFTTENEDAVYTAIDMALRAQRFAKLPRVSGSPAGHYVRALCYGPDDARRGHGDDILPAIAFVGPFAARSEAEAHAATLAAMSKPARYAGQYEADEIGCFAADPEGWHYSSVWIKAPAVQL